jgi:hypothetical protein
MEDCMIDDRRDCDSGYGVDDDDDPWERAVPCFACRQLALGDFCADCEVIE